MKLGKHFKVTTWTLTLVALVLIYKYDNMFRNPETPRIQALPYMIFLFFVGGLILFREGAAFAHLGDRIRLRYILLITVLWLITCIPIYLLKMTDVWLPKVLLFDLALIGYPIIWATTGNWFFDYERDMDEEVCAKCFLGSAILWVIITAGAFIPLEYIWMV